MFEDLNKIKLKKRKRKKKKEILLDLYSNPALIVVLFFFLFERQI